MTATAIPDATRPHQNRISGHTYAQIAATYGVTKAVRVKLRIHTSLIFDQLRSHMLNFQTGRKGCRIVGSGAFECAKFLTNLVWKEMASLPEAEYEAWRSGQRGQTWPLATNTVSISKVLLLDDERSFAVPSATEDSYSGKRQTKVVENRSRTARNWIHKLTDGTGFPLFAHWDHYDVKGNLDPVGRGKMIGHINLRWVFGDPDFSALEAGAPAPKMAENQPLENGFAENFSAITRIQENPEKKKEVERIGLTAQDPADDAAKPQTDTHTAHEHTPNGSGSVKAESEYISPGPGGGAAYDRALRLWNLLFQFIYLPLFGTGRIRFNGESAYEKADFTHFQTEKAVKMMEEMLQAARQGGEYSLELAEQRLETAIKSQQKYMADNQKTWIGMPAMFLRIGRANGTLETALRTFVRERIQPLAEPEIPENEDWRAKKSRLYRQLVAMGATNHVGNFTRWCANLGFPHIEACLSVMSLTIQKRRAAGAMPGKEFDKNKGGASAYFASLVSRYDSSAIQKEADAITAAEAKNRAWQSVAWASRPQGDHSPENLAHKEKLDRLSIRIRGDQAFREIAIPGTLSMFAMTGMTRLDYQNLALIEAWVLAQEIQK